MSVPKTAMKLVDGLPLWVKTIHGKFTTTDALFCVVQLVADMESLCATHSNHSMAILIEPFGLNSFSASRLV